MDRHLLVVMALVDSDDSALVRTVEEHVPCEIQSHFTSMTAYHCLRDDKRNTVVNSNNDDNDEEKDSSSVHTFRGRRRHLDLRCSRDVHVEGCSTRVLSCMPAQVLTGYCVLWAESTLCVRTSDLTASHAWRTGRRRRRRLQHVEGVGNDDEGRQQDKEGEQQEQQHEIKLLSLHIVDRMAQEEPLRHSFALQSVCQPGCVLQLECYPYHMVYFGLLMCALWRCPEKLFDAVREGSRRPRQEGHVTPGEEVAGSATTSLTTESMWLLKELLALPTATRRTTTARESAVLLLGLGGNVIGNCLDATIPLDVPIDVVEVEPAVLETCRRHGQIPPCEEQANRAGCGASVWVVSQGHRRHPHYRFILGDAEAVLRENMKKNNNCNGGLFCGDRYGLIFLDCYDPAREKMMHDGGLVDVCRAHLAPGGALIVNAHILPTRDALEEQFLSRGFASVQVLRVAACDQSIVVCLTSGNADAATGDKEEARCDRFCVRHACQMARYIQHALEEAPSDAQRMFAAGVWNSARWLKSSRCLKTASCNARTWEHYD